MPPSSGVVFSVGGAKLEEAMKNSIFQRQRDGRFARWMKNGLLAAGALPAILLAAAAAAKPVIVHHPVQSAVKGEPLGLRATVRDAGGRVSSVAVFYAPSRGSAPLRRDLSTTGAGIWYGTIPGHLVGPWSNLFYCVHAENSAGKSTDTEWIEVKVVEPGLPGEDMTDAASSSPAVEQAQKQDNGDEAEAPSLRKYLIPAAIVIGGAAAVGGGIALANRGGGGGGGDSSSNSSSSATSGSSSRSSGGSSSSRSASSSSGSSSSSNNNSNSSGSSSSDGNSSSSSASSESSGGNGAQGNGTDGGGGDGTTGGSGTYGGSYNVCFEPSGSGSDTGTSCESGTVNVYVDNGTVQVAGLWGGEVLSGSMSGNSFTAACEVGGRQDFPPAHLIVSGDVGSSSCSARVDGYSMDAERPGSFTGNVAAALR